ncbi:hypothetical protein ONS95_011368 [Cadophora gregata]|uniref:uncharacterized protein n=1 Tax=Cadophora gregata TaxID=51156 RepID=UPI0026DB07F7|nr:uncharacterized protein ONS95_011368 [Cadophora gregata]KAK0119944.1 hypothetical protein ONS95_011368 [Cadophora gregata]KAK0120978.1 hypothetical protein ONS96_011171 [Cadophora gregata f. sp. sojae]
MPLLDTRSAGDKVGNSIKDLAPFVVAPNTIHDEHGLLFSMLSSLHWPVAASTL